MARLGKPQFSFEPGSDVDPITEDVAVLDHHVADVEPNPTPFLTPPTPLGLSVAQTRARTLSLSVY